MQNRLERLAERLVEAKRKEVEANIARVTIEAEIIGLLGAKEEGSQTHALENGLKLTITGRLSYSADIDELEKICEQIPASLRPIKVEKKIDETGAKYLRANEPDIWAKIAQVITVKPAKTSITLKG